MSLANLNYPKQFNNDYELIDYLGSQMRAAEAWNQTAERLTAAHDYVKTHCMPEGWGKNVWHTILEDACKLREQLLHLDEENKKLYKEIAQLNEMNELLRKS
jgi:hypothetical protein